MTHTAEEIKALAYTEYELSPKRSPNYDDAIGRACIVLQQEAFINGYTKALEQVKSEGHKLETMRKALERISNSTYSPDFIVDIALEALYTHPVSGEDEPKPPSKPPQ